MNATKIVDHADGVANAASRHLRHTAVATNAGWIKAFGFQSLSHSRSLPITKMYPRISEGTRSRAGIETLGALGGLQVLSVNNASARKNEQELTRLVTECNN